jgi:Zn-dependent protease/CBS domain-containing protein
MRGSFKIGRIAGIDIGIHYSWLLAFGLFAWVFSRGQLPASFPGWSLTTYWTAGVLISLALFVSVLIHELCHSLVARSRGLKVSSIVLFIFGGVSNIESEPEKPGVEFLMSAAGPASSFVLGVIFYGFAYLVQSSGQTDTPLYAVLYFICYTNIVLAIFNILPGFPLDGGRVLRSIIWGATKSLEKATMIAGNIGRAFGWAFIIFGVLSMFDINVWIFQSGFINGIWSIMIGWFLTSAADNVMREMSLQQHLAGVRVKDVMDRTPECVVPGASVDSVVHDSFIQRGRRAVPVCIDGKLVGIVTLTDVKKVPQQHWINTPVTEVMTRSPLLSVNQEDDLNGALKILAQNGLNQIPVMLDTKLVGLLSRADVIRYLQTRQELGVNSKPNPTTGV